VCVFWCLYVQVLRWILFLMLLWVYIQLAEHWTNIPKVAGSIPTMVTLTFQPARCMWIYIQSNITKTSNYSQFIQVLFFSHYYTTMFSTDCTAMCCSKLKFSWRPEAVIFQLFPHAWQAILSDKPFVQSP
jgi:hypothetical protein